jgi:hypothetical protein
LEVRVWNCRRHSQAVTLEWSAGSAVEPLKSWTPLSTIGTIGHCC